jgi:hypothetical protein
MTLGDIRCTRCYLRHCTSNPSADIIWRVLIIPVLGGHETYQISVLSSVRETKEKKWSWIKTLKDVSFIWSWSFYLREHAWKLSHNRVAHKVYNRLFLEWQVDIIPAEIGQLRIISEIRHGGHGRSPDSRNRNLSDTNRNLSDTKRAWSHTGATWSQWALVSSF